jgi:ketosteroid isomerase-like protein
VVEQLVDAINAHDLDRMVSLFADDYVNETPAHPHRAFEGNENVRRNWSQIFAGAPDLRAQVPRMVVDADTVWVEWDITGTGPDGAAVLMRGVSIFGVRQNRLAWVRFYLEPVETISGGHETHIGHMMGASTGDGADVTGMRS